ncbi:MAG: 30S ribosomal protein S8 [Planctomycetaceae bacterium]|jgi:small subunit ribosomal protein S8|nr:30S ribosomal protein S8 [Planctomycetaceae bacterium]
MMTDTIADMLTRIRNAVRVEHTHVDIPHSKLKFGVADVLKREGYIWDFEVTMPENEKSPIIRIQLKYGPNGERVIQHVKRISKPGRRVYQRANLLKPVLNGLGINILSTNKGVISDREARQSNVGGEVICEIW